MITIIIFLITIGFLLYFHSELNSRYHKLYDKRDKEYNNSRSIKIKSVVNPDSRKYKSKITPIIILINVLFLIFSCKQKEPNFILKYKIGDIVYMKLDSTKCIITHVNHYSYDIQYVDKNNIKQEVYCYNQDLLFKQ